MTDEKTDDARRLGGLAGLGYAEVALVVTAGPEKGRRFPLGAGENIIGRSAESEAPLEENEVSRRHACVRVGREIELEDLGSAVGTVLNGRMMMGKDFLFDNDEIRIASNTLRLEVKRRESRRGILVAAVCLVVAGGLLALALAYPERFMAESEENGGPSAAAEAEDPADAWRNWENLRLPDREALADEGVETTPESAEAQFNYATRLYDGRFADIGNAYQALLFYKRALAILRHIQPLEDRPAVAHRSLERIRALQKMIRRDLKKRVFAFRRYYRQKWWRRCFRALDEIRRICPWDGDRHHRWAARRSRDLRRSLQG